MLTSVPPPAALKEFLGATTRHTRRIEIYEQDGITRWEKDTVTRLKDGSVSVDYTRDERRALDLVLSNTDGVLINAPGEFWYDKIIKVYRGVQVNEKLRLPKILVLSDKTADIQLAPSFHDVMVAGGYGDIQVNTLASDYDVDIAPFDIIVSLGAATVAQIDALEEAYRQGKSVLVQDIDAGAWIEGTFTSYTKQTIAGGTVAPLSTIAHPVSKGWSSFANTDLTSVSVYTVTSSEWTMISPVVGATTRARVAAFAEPINGGRAVALSFAVNVAQYDNVEFQKLLLSSIRWLNTVQALTTWEIQIGEFMIDRISEPHFPHEVRITGRDYTKKCMLSKYAHATQFVEGLALESLIASIAGSAGISKRLLPVTGIVVGRSFFFERGVSRWEAMKEIATAYDHELFFDPQGYLVLRLYNDPATTAPVLYVETGKEGQVASYQKSTTDSRIYNHIIITGESSDVTVLPVWAELKNENPDSPTCIQELGDRLFEYSSAFIQTQQQADDLAASFLSIHSLEEFELAFDSLVIPWVDAGDILGWIDPNPAPDDPTTFLLAQVTLPLGLGPMSSVARRVTNVGG